MATMEMCSRIRVSSCQLWIICLTVILMKCEANVPSRRSWEASHRVAPVWDLADDAMHLFVNDVQPPIRHRKFSKLDRLMEKRLGIPLSNFEASSEEVDGHKNDRNTATIIGTTTNDKKPYFKRDDRDALRFNDDLIKQTYKESKKDENTSGEVWKVKMDDSQSRKKSDQYLEKLTSNLQNKRKSSAENEMMQKALDYYNKMKKETRCQIPSSVVVHVKDEFPNTDPDWQLTYLPTCIRLHRCSSRSGCCYSPTRQCSAIKTENVQLPFKISVTGRNGTDVRYEYLTFKNHTKCSCELIVSDEKMQQDANYSPATSIYEYDSSVESSNNISWNNDCHCPYPFTKRALPDDTCICDCFDKDKACLKKKHGVEHLAQDQRRCIESGKCSLPMCEYGMYGLTRGKCPRNYGV